MRGLLAAAAGFLLLAAPAAAQVTPEDLAQAEAELRQAQHELDAMASRYEEAVAAEARLSADLGRLQEMATLMETELEHVRDLLRQRVAEMYIEGGSPDVSLLLDADSIAELSARLGYLEQVGAADRQLVRRLEVTRRQYEVNVAALARAAEEQAEAVAQLEQMTTELTTALEEASSRYQTLFEQWRQQEQARREAEARRRAEEAARRAATSTTTTLAVEQPADVGQAQTVPTTTVPTTTIPPTTAPPATDPPSSTQRLH
ncbi:MAG: hypothetical protein M3N51_06340, partial [Actinomycetota bacterium]|nr:hypothetical protein [Actinomycetota bacterium]